MGVWTGVGRDIFGGWQRLVIGNEPEFDWIDYVDFTDNHCREAGGFSSLKGLSGARRIAAYGKPRYVVPFMSGTFRATPGPAVGGAHDSLAC